MPGTKKRPGAESNQEHELGGTTSRVAPILDARAQQARRAQLAGWVLSLLGASAIVNDYWETAPLLSAGIAVAVLGAVNGLQSLIVTVMHNRRSQQA